MVGTNLFDLALEVLASDEVGDVVIILTTLLVLLGDVLVALGELAQGSQGVGSELVQDAGDELGELLVLTSAVDGEGVGGDGGVDYTKFGSVLSLHVFVRHQTSNKRAVESAVEDNGKTYPWGQRSG